MLVSVRGGNNPGRKGITVNRTYSGYGHGSGHGSGSPGSEKPKVYRKVDWCVRMVTLIVCLPFLFGGYGLGAAYTLAKEGWHIGRDV